MCAEPMFRGPERRTIIRANEPVPMSTGRFPGDPGPVRILFVAGLDPLLAQGHALHVRHLASELAARGHRVDLITRDDGGTLDWDPPGRLARLAPVALPLFRQVEREFRTALLLRRWIRELNPDVVLARSEALAFGPLLVPDSTPLAVESNSSVVAQTAAAEAWRAWLARSVERWVLRRAARIGVVAPSLRDLHVRHHGVDPERMFVVPNGAFLPPPIDEDAVRELRIAGHAQEREFVLVLSGSASERIEFGWLVAALEATPSARLWVVGQGELWPVWQEQACRSAASDRIEFLGAFSEAEAARRLQSAQAIVAPYAEGRTDQLGQDPLKVLAGMASGRLLLASGVPSDPPFDRLGAGIRVEGNREAWVRVVNATAAEWNGAGSPVQDWPRTGVGAGRKWIREHRTWAQSAEIWEHELEMLLRKHRS